MIYILIPALIILMGMTLVSLLRGLNAFRHGMDDDAAREPGSGASEFQLKQNQMMIARIKYQAMAIVVVMVLLFAAKK